ncbi:threonine-phosphate decarboxylase CobD [Bacillus sp. Marseille-Q3570]|uniref:threonine-phosphate decarboxylase CobD n=1 Tax=Bacillus sp. Marseille-Q3570 TaxID=2963522 RepID=UPI0021B71293|nr:threonine-phosphate decarboxylase CobD [Bacillus sp. Marseille-Q3570]
MDWPSHGSNPKYLYEAIDLRMPEEIIDFSANINPLGPPSELKDKWKDIFHRIIDYPDPHATSLRKGIAEVEQVDPQSILIGNGGAELISLITRLLAGKDVLIVQPAFSEYEKSCHVNGCNISYHQLEDPLWQLDIDRLQPKLEEVDAVFLCNPNNPTGVQYRFEMVLALIDACKRSQCRIILDEAFYDMLEDYRTFIPYIEKFENLIIIRSMTKMYAVPGLRLGYMVAHPEIIRRVGRFQTHWSVNSLALAAGEICLQNASFLHESRQYINEERRKLFAFFTKEGYRFSPSKVNFYLLRDPDSDDQLPLFRHLLEQGIVPRHTFNFSGLDGKWLRFAIKSSYENNELSKVLKKWKRPHT